MLSETYKQLRQRLFFFRCSLITLAVLELGVRLIALHVRIKDTWYSSVVDECRAGDLREDTYNFIHGYPTSACGSSLLEQASSCDCQVVIDAGLMVSAAPGYKNGSRMFLRVQCMIRTR